jgi:exodeoxyribonuclease VII large subunit
VQAIRYRLILASRDLHQRGTERAGTVVHRTIAKCAQSLDELHDRVLVAQRQSLARARQKFTELAKRLEAANLRLRFARMRHQQELLHQRLTKLGPSAVLSARRRYEPVCAHLTQLSPLAILSRGYAIVSNAGGHAVRAATEVKVGEQVTIKVHSGGLRAEVTQTVEREPL